jgi:adenylate cyclase class 2
VRRRPDFSGLRDEIIRGLGMLEVEVKFAVADFAPLEAVLAQWNAQLEPPRRDEDRYFNAPDRDFAQTDEALRIRSIGEINALTYKGRKCDPDTKTRLEIEVPFASGAAAADNLARLLVQLGYRPVATVRKTRRVAHFRHGGFMLQATLDEVAGVGRFAEVETMADESRFAEAKTAVLAAAAQLGMTQPERRSYLQLLLSDER